MTFEARAVNPRSKNKWRIEIEGLDAALAFKVNIPEVEVVPKTHQAPGLSHPTSYAGDLKYGDIELEKVMPADEADEWAWDWFKQAIDPNTHEHGSPSDYKKDLIIWHLKEDGSNLEGWRVKGAFVLKLGYDDQESEDASAKILEKVTLRPDSYDKI